MKLVVTTVVEGISTSITDTWNIEYLNTDDEVQACAAKEIERLLAD